MTLNKFAKLLFKSSNLIKILLSFAKYFLCYISFANLYVIYFIVILFSIFYLNLFKIKKYIN